MLPSTLPSAGCPQPGLMPTRRLTPMDPFSRMGDREDERVICSLLSMHEGDVGGGGRLQNRLSKEITR